MTAQRSTDWPNAAAALAGVLPLTRLDPAVRRWTERTSRSRIPWHVALSGGADSVALLLTLWAHWPRRRTQLQALHFDHRLRGATAGRADQAFCRRLCAGLGIKLIVGEWKRRSSDRRQMGAPQVMSEAQARLARMSFFERHARVLWLGHQQDDVAESVLMRLARGSGAAGLAAPRPVQEISGRRVHLRPLLGLRKAEIVKTLRQCRVPWREDATNAVDTYFRNRIRRTVIPSWIKASQRDAVAGAARSRELLEEDDMALEAWLDELAPIDRRGELDLATINGKPRGMIRRAVHRWLLAQRRVFHLSRQAVDALILAVERGEPTRHSLGPEQFAVIRGGRLRFEVGKRRRKFQRPVN
jgi:tRNA(Ile)-lysidine synthase